MPEFEISLIYTGWYDDDADAFEHADMVALTAERANSDIVLDVAIKELNP